MLPPLPGEPTMPRFLITTVNRLPFIAAEQRQYPHQKLVFTWLGPLLRLLRARAKGTAARTNVRLH
jgi:hypothetical protein